MVMFVKVITRQTCDIFETQYSCCQQGHIGSKTSLQKILQFLTGVPANTDWPV